MKQSAEDNIVDVDIMRFFEESCMRHLCFHAKDSQNPVYCKTHAEDGTVNVRGKYRLHVLIARHEASIPPFAKYVVTM